MTHTIDATNKSLRTNRFRSGAYPAREAFLLISQKTKYSPDKVEIVNAAQTKMNDKKADQKAYPKYSGYPGGLRFEKLDKVIKEKGYKEVYTRAIKRMLPSNRLRDLRLKNLIVTE